MTEIELSSMKIFKKNYHQNNLNWKANISIAKIFLDTTISCNEILFEAIDYDDYLETKGELNWDDLMDGILGDFRNKEFTHVIEYSKNLIVITSDLHPEIESCYKIDLNDLCMGLQVIANETDFSFLENYLIKSEPKSTNIINNQINNLPEITDYISQHTDAFKNIYYPGAGDDFTSLQLFGRYADAEKIIFTDYFNASEVTKIRYRIDERGENVVKLTPGHFNKKTWHQFWPSNREAFSEEYHHPNHAWGRLLEFKQRNESFQFYYLGTEAVKTASILIENGIYPDVLVLQDHGFGGNWSTFGEESSPLHQVMKDNLPEYILIAPEGNTDIWPGYEQVTKPYIPAIVNANSAHRSKRALYKKKVT